MIKYLLFTAAIIRIPGRTTFYFDNKKRINTVAVIFNTKKNKFMTLFLP